ncbi:Bug family tripartite tricarboxylate transporter substrate binding protein [Achromobacter anxifer]|uniref:Bug family tripartite tricarboxylate transporter substrate binding protein n=1 Tax=Achromobacter anxifer TaxID=1287737 RepID=UPI002158754C|nr:tripartite tricarboxylate transporter substrate binding protein [Achromobacter anxifer]
MKTIKKTLKFGLACVMALGCAAAMAQSAYPDRPIRWIVPSPAGAPIDAIGRKLGELMSAQLGAAIVIENKPGAASTIGAAEVARAKPDGYTLMLSVGDALISSVVTMKVPYDPQRDFTLISKIAASGPVLIVNKSMPAGDLSAAVQAARTAQIPLAYGSYGPGSYPQLIMESLARQASVNLIEVPYKGSPPAMTDLLGGQLAFTFTSTNLAAPMVADGKVKAIAVIGDKRSALLPQVQTFAEAGYDSFIFKNKAWVGLSGPAGMPSEVVQKLAAAAQKVVRSPEFGKYLENIGFDAVGNTPEEFLKEYREEYAVVPGLIKELGVAAH